MVWSSNEKLSSLEKRFACQFGFLLRLSSPEEHANHATKLLSSTWGQSRQIDLSHTELKKQERNLGRRASWILMKWPAVLQLKNEFFNCQNWNILFLSWGFFFYEVFSQLIFLISSHGKSRKVSISHLIIIISICGWEGCCQSGFLVADLIFKCLWIALETRRLLPTDQESSTEKLGRSKRWHVKLKE